jgi:hypothetical protein
MGRTRRWFGADPALVWLGTGIAVGLLVLVLYAFQYGWSEQALTVATGGSMVAGAALMAGAILGFLFGVPIAGRSNVRKADGDSEGETAGSLEVNTSLQEISDWLTKILVGVGLVELGQLVPRLSALVAFLGPTFGPSSLAQPICASVLGYFAVAGFLVGYLGTRLHLGPAFRRADRRLRDVTAESVSALTDLKTGVEHLTKSAEQFNNRQGQSEDTIRRILGILDGILTNMRPTGSKPE